MRPSEYILLPLVEQCIQNSCFSLGSVIGDRFSPEDVKLSILIWGLGITEIYIVGYMYVVYLACLLYILHTVQIPFFADGHKNTYISCYKVEFAKWNYS